jgi:hypothetical protein
MGVISDNNRLKNYTASANWANPPEKKALTGLQDRFALLGLVPTEEATLPETQQPAAAQQPTQQRQAATTEANPRLLNYLQQNSALIRFAITGQQVPTGQGGQRSERSNNPTRSNNTPSTGASENLRLGTTSVSSIIFAPELPQTQIEQDLPEPPPQRQQQQGIASTLSDPIQEQLAKQNAYLIKMQQQRIANAARQQQTPAQAQGADPTANPTQQRVSTPQGVTTTPLNGGNLIQTPKMEGLIALRTLPDGSSMYLNPKDPTLRKGAEIALKHTQKGTGRSCVFEMFAMMTGTDDGSVPNMGFDPKKFRSPASNNDARDGFVNIASEFGYVPFPGSGQLDTIKSMYKDMPDVQASRLTNADIQNLPDGSPIYITSFRDPNNNTTPYGNHLAMVSTKNGRKEVVAFARDGFQMEKGQMGVTYPGDVIMYALVPKSSIITEKKAPTPLPMDTLPAGQIITNRE